MYIDTKEKSYSPSKSWIRNQQGIIVGFVSGNVFYTFRSYKESQIFRLFGNAVALDKSIIRILLQNKIESICYIITDFPNDEPFEARIKLIDFLNESQDTPKFNGINSTPQRMLSIHNKAFNKVYIDNKRMGEYCRQNESI